MIIMQLLTLLITILPIHFKVKMTGQTGNNGIKNVEIMVPVKHLSNDF